MEVAVMLATLFIFALTLSGSLCQDEEVETTTSIEETTTMDPSGCSYNFNEPEGIFATRNFPDEYETFSNCTWNITVEEGKKVKLTFHLFNVEQNPTCLWDWVKVIDTNGTLIKHICGYLQQDLVIHSTGNSMKIHFYADNTINSAGFLASWSSVDEIEESKPSDAGYMLSFPQTFTTESDSSAENLCLQMLNLKDDGQVTISLFSKKEIISNEASTSINVDVFAGDEEIHCHKLSLPRDFADKYAIVGIKADINGYKILSFKSVRALQSKPNGLIQTDKFDYRPQQKVYIRTLLMNDELKPSRDEKIDELWVQDPSGSRVMQWKNLKLKKGLVQEDYQLPEEPILGKWLVKAKVGKLELVAPFEVNESVLPSFEVTIDAPKAVIKDSQGEDIKVCAKYTHGANIKGKANVTVSTKFKVANYWRAPETSIEINKVVEIDGCATITLSAEELKNITRKNSPLKIEAEVKELATGEKQSTKKDGIPIKNTPFQITSGTSPKSHILNAFPYVGEVKVVDHNDQPMDNVNLNVCVRLYTSLGKMRDYLNSHSYKFYQYSEEDLYNTALKILGIKVNENCSDRQTNDQGMLRFAIDFANLEIPENVTKLSLEITARDFPDNKTTGMEQPKLKHEVSLTHTNSSTTLSLQPDSSKLNCGPTNLEMFVSGLAGSKVELTYFIASGASMVASGAETIEIGEETQLEEFIGDAKTIKFDVVEPRQDTNKIILKRHGLTINRPFPNAASESDEAKVLVYVRDAETNQVLTNTQDFDLEPCEGLKTEISFNRDQVRPRDPLVINLAGPSDGYCGISIVDKSVSLIHNPNKVSKDKIKKLKTALRDRKIVNDKVTGESCQDASLLFKAFEKLGLFVLSDQLQSETDCDALVDATANVLEKAEPVFDEVEIAYDSPPVFAEFAAGPVPTSANRFAGAPAPAAAPPPPPLAAARPDTTTTFRPDGSSNEIEEIEASQIDLRNFFPETWLFDMVDLDPSGKKVLNRVAPDTVTTWVADAFCTSDSEGLSISDETTFKVDQDFFIDTKLPYSIKRNEIMPLNITVFNKLRQRSLPLKLSVEKSDEYKSDEREAHICVDAQNSQTEVFTVILKELSEVNITVKAVIEPLKGCGDVSDAIGFADAIQKPIQVKPEGFPVEEVSSEFICRNSNDPTSNVDLGTIELPDTLVEGSARSWVSVSGDILAPSMNNLDKLVKMPYGCGEQNMISMVPNIYVAKYLEGTNQEKPELMKKAKAYMQKGYDRQNDKYRHKEGYYSIWGPSDSNAKPSIWLTAFVVKAFRQASRFIEVDRLLLEESQNWLNMKQDRESGCYKTEGFYVYSHFKKESDIALTASILISMTEGQRRRMNREPKSVGLALKCLDENVNSQTSIYTKSLAAYAYALASKTGKSEKLMEDMRNEAIDSLGKMSWKVDKNSTFVVSQDVEISAYNLLTLIKHEKLAEALKITKWLATQRNANGGFKSTQDTMIALQALAEYSQKINERDNDLDVKIESGSEEIKFNVNEDNELLLQMMKVPVDAEKSTKVTAEVIGVGCFVVQSILRYNVKESPETSAFNLSVKLENNDLEVCSSYVGDKESTNMVVIEVEMLSGYRPDMDSLEALTDDNKMVKKVEYDEKTTTVALYFNDMPKDASCLSFKVNEKLEVKDRKPALAKIYDYYDQKDILSIEYNDADN